MALSQSLFSGGPDDNPVAQFCSDLAYFPNTPLGVLSAVSNFTRSQDLVSWLHRPFCGAAAL